MSANNKRLIDAAVADGLGGFAIKRVALGAPEADEVMVEIKAAGICHTDVDSVNQWQYPFVVGHEGAGIVSAVGRGVSHVAVGDAVILNWAIPCGECFCCVQGNQHICEVNSPVTGDGHSGHAHSHATTLEGVPLKRSFHLGTMSQATIVKSAAVTKITSPNLEFTSASILGCGVMTGVGSVINAAQLKTGSTAVVIGCGGVGLNVIQGCKIAGATRIIAVDVNNEKATAALAFGATDTLVSDVQDTDFKQVKESVIELLGRGADYAFECTAIPELALAPLAVIRHGGMAVQASGIEQRMEVDCELFEWDKVYINPLYGQCKPQLDFAMLQDFHQSGRLQLEPLISKTYSLSQLQQGFDDLLAGKIVKGVVVFDD